MPEYQDRQGYPSVIDPNILFNVFDEAPVLDMHGSMLASAYSKLLKPMRCELPKSFDRWKKTSNRLLHIRGWSLSIDGP